MLAQFITGGGYSEQLAAARMAHRRQASHHPTNRTNPFDPTDRHPAQRPKPHKAPDCQRCGRPMALRTARPGPRAGSQFWGCSGYPECKGTVPL